MKKGIRIIQIIAGMILAFFSVNGIYDHLPNRWFVPVFLLFPVVLLLLLNGISNRINLWDIVKSYGFCSIIYSVVLFIVRPWKYYHLVFRKAPLFLGLAGVFGVFFLLFIILLKKLSTSILASAAAGFLLGFFLPALFWNVNTLYDHSTVIEAETTVKKVISDYGMMGKQITLKEIPIEGMEESIWIRGNHQVIEKEEEVVIRKHQGLFHAGWCEIIIK